MADTSTTQAQCAGCSKTTSESGTNLKLCGKCHTTHYCSRECQKADWKRHKKVCASNAAGRSGASANLSPSMSTDAGRTPKGLSVAIDKPFHRLEAKTWLHDRPEADVYKLLIDTYRLRMDDNYNLESDADVDGIYGGAPDGRPGFLRFLRLAETRPGLLPPWWSQEKAAECEAVGARPGWSSLSTAVEKSDVIKHYENSEMPMQLRVLGEQVYGRGPGGQGSTALLKIQMMAEGGGMASSTMDMSSMFRRS